LDAADVCRELVLPAFELFLLLREPNRRSPGDLLVACELGLARVEPCLPIVESPCPPIRGPLELGYLNGTPFERLLLGRGELLAVRELRFPTVELPFSRSETRVGASLELALPRG